MANPSARTALWNWSVEGPLAASQIRAALAGVLGRPIVSLGAVAATEVQAGTVFCDIWYGTGEFPVSVDCYGAPTEPAEPAVLAAFARRVGRRCLLPDDTLSPSRHLLIAPDGTLRPVHLDIEQTEDGEARSNLRLCTLTEPWCRHPARCGRSRWAPDSVVPALAAA